MVVLDHVYTLQVEISDTFLLKRLFFIERNVYVFYLLKDEKIKLFKKFLKYILNVIYI